MKKTRPILVTKSRLIKGFRKLGLASGDTIMLHASVKTIGWIVGGPDVVIQALLDVLGPRGTLMMFVGWEDSPYELASWPKNDQRAYLKECPPFNPVKSRAHRKWSILTEYLRTWPKAYRSNHPDASFAAVGAKAEWITEDHPLQYGYGEGSPLAKLCEAHGKVLLLGASFDSLTILHYAEHLARIPNKTVVCYKMPVLRNRRRIWIELEEFDTCGGVLPNAERNFELIPREYLASGKGRTDKVGEAQCYLFDATDLVRFAVQWLERKYGTRRNQS